jgi:hypothetical protein
MAGDKRSGGPYASNRGFELKQQLIRAAVAATDAVRLVDPSARILWCEPLVNIAPASGCPNDVTHAREEAELQFQAFDMLCGRLEPELGGRPDILDIVGVNIYSHNQWNPHGHFIPFGHHTWRPFSGLLHDVAGRYGRPVIVAETGAEGTAAPPGCTTSRPRWSRRGSRGRRSRGSACTRSATTRAGTTRGCARPGCWARRTSRDGGRSTSRSRESCGGCSGR